MKWFFAVNERGNEFENYAKMLKVAVATAAKHTSLEPCFLYDGEDNHLTAWLNERGVRIIRTRSFLYEQLADAAERKNNPEILAIGSGAFLRTEIPKLTSELGIDDEFVLYTDVDVMFVGGVDGLEHLRPKYFAVAPEMDPADFRNMNSGVMLMNLPALRSEDDRFRRFILKNLDTLVADAWDQTAYKMYYRRALFGFRWDKLPLRYNWKAYWPASPEARIIHFHGPKPHQRERLRQPPTTEHLKMLLTLATDEYLKLSADWDQAYWESEEPVIT